MRAQPLEPDEFVFHIAGKGRGPGTGRCYGPLGWLWKAVEKEALGEMPGTPSNWLHLRPPRPIKYAVGGVLQESFKRRVLRSGVWTQSTANRALSVPTRRCLTISGSQPDPMAEYTHQQATGKKHGREGGNM